MVMSNFGIFLFCPSSTFNIRKSHKSSGGKALYFQRYQAETSQGGGGTPPPPVSSGLIVGMRNHWIRNDSQLWMFTLYRMGFRSGSKIYLIQCEQCSRKSKRTRSDWSISVVFFSKATWPRVQVIDNEIPFQQMADLRNSPITLWPGSATKAMRYGTYQFWNQCIGNDGQLRKL